MYMSWGGKSSSWKLWPQFCTHLLNLNGAVALRMDVLGQLRLSSTEQGAGLGRKHRQQGGKYATFSAAHPAVAWHSPGPWCPPGSVSGRPPASALLAQGPCAPSSPVPGTPPAGGEKDNYPDFVIWKLSHSQGWGIPRDVQDLGKLPLSGPNVTRGLGECLACRDAQ